MNNLIKIGLRIKKTRLEKGMTQAELAKKCGWTKSIKPSARISHYENGARSASTNDLAIIAKVLKVSASWLAYGDEKKY